MCNNLRVPPKAKSTRTRAPVSPPAGMDSWQQSLAETLVNGSPGQLGSSGNVANYIGKLNTLEGFLRQVFGTRGINQILHVIVVFIYVLQSIMHLILLGNFYGGWGGSAKNRVWLLFIKFPLCIYLFF
ncbi:hypothetical protein ACB092_09G177700 [Castanea dentata]